MKQINTVSRKSTCRRLRCCALPLFLVTTWVAFGGCTPPKKEPWPRKLYSTVFSLAFSPDGKLLASGEGRYKKDDSNTIRIFDVATATELRSLSADKSNVFSVVFSPDGRSLASGTGDRALRLWDVESGNLIDKMIAHRSWVLSVAYSPGGDLLATGSDDYTIALWDARKRQTLGILRGHSGEVRCVVFSPDGKLLASAGGQDDRTVRLWDIGSQKEIRVLKGHRLEVRSVAFSPDGKTVASASKDWTVKLWDVATGQLKHTLWHGSGVSCVAWSRHDVLASSSGDAAVRLWDSATGKYTETLREHTGYGSPLAFSPDGELLASGGGIQILITNLRTRKSVSIPRTPIEVQERPDIHKAEPSE